MVVVWGEGQALRGRRQCTWLRLLGAGMVGGGASASQRVGCLGVGEAVGAGQTGRRRACCGKSSPLELLGGGI